MSNKPKKINNANSVTIGATTYTDIPNEVLAVFREYMERTQTEEKRLYSINRETGEAELVQIIQTDRHPTTRDALQYMRNLYPQYFDRVAFIQAQKMRAQIELIEGGGDDTGELLKQVRDAFKIEGPEDSDDLED